MKFGFQLAVRIERLGEVGAAEIREAADIELELRAIERRGDVLADLGLERLGIEFLVLGLPRAKHSRALGGRVLQRVIGEEDDADLAA